MRAVSSGTDATSGCRRSDMGDLRTRKPSNAIAHHKAADFANGVRAFPAHAGPGFTHDLGLEDPRETSRCDHQLIDILVIAVCAVIACAESWEDIALYGRSKRACLETFLALPNGIPSHRAHA